MTVQGPVQEQQPDGMSHRGGGGGIIFIPGQYQCRLPQRGRRPLSITNGWPIVVLGSK